METNFNASQTARKLNRKIKADRPKCIGLGILTCVLAPLPYAGTWLALAAGIMAFGLIAKGLLALHNFEIALDDAGVTDAEADRLMPQYQPLLVTAALCFVSMVVAAVISSKLAGTVAELMGVMA